MTSLIEPDQDGVDGVGQGGVERQVELVYSEAGFHGGKLGEHSSVTYRGVSGVFAR